jgi:hypothetical protein
MPCKGEPVPKGLDMNREDFEHIIRAAATVTNEYEFVIVGSQSPWGPSLRVDSSSGV